MSIFDTDNKMLKEICKLPDKDDWINSFIKSDKFQSILLETSKIDRSPIILFDRNSLGEDPPRTPRQYELKRNHIDLQPFYILDFISNNSTGSIFDIGCGFNFFKKFYNIVGIDPFSLEADINDEFNDSFAHTHANSMDNIFSINAIHFVSIVEIQKRIENYFNLTKKNGYAYLSMNVERVLDWTYDKTKNTKNIENFYFPKNDLSSEIDSMINDALSNLDVEILLYNNKINEIVSDSVNGNIRILVKRK